MICEYCLEEHDGTFGSGRFCSNFCSRGFSTKAKRAEINNKVREKQTGKKASEETREKLRLIWQDPEIRRARNIKIRKTDSSYCPKWWLFSKKLEMCEECGVGPWHNSKPLVLQIHHKDGNNRNNAIENLQVLCPNCHTQTHNFAGKGRKIKKS